MHVDNTTLSEVRHMVATGNLDQAESICKKILEENPYQHDALHLLGLISIENKHYGHAVEIYKKLVTIQTNNTDYHYNLAKSYLHSNLFDLAINHLRRTITLQPNMADAHRDLCHALVNIDDVKAAVSSGKKAILLAPNDASTYEKLAVAYEARGNFNTAFKNYLKASQLSPSNPSIQFNLGNAYTSRGDQDAAKKCFRNVITMQPNNLVAYGNIVRITKYFNHEHEDAVQLKAFISQSHLPNEDRIIALFSLGKIYQDCSLYDEAFSYFKESNQLQDNNYQFNPAQPVLATTLLIDNCTSDLIKRKHKISNSIERPIFIVGTPRSGTTLIEQIVSSHSDVFGAGELQWIPTMTQKLQKQLKSSSEYPRCLNDLTKKSIKKLALKYSQYTQKLSNGEPRIVDKLPGNFLHLGFIHTLFPNAKIIHCRRDPKDSCISMFCERFPLGVPYSYNLYKLGAFYSQYERIMMHWREVLPDNSMIEIEYENVINNQEAESRRLLHFLDLAWQDDCLTFHKQKRTVQTASDTQVTKPLYSSSIGRWKHYRKHLQPLEDGFNSWGD